MQRVLGFIFPENHLRITPLTAYEIENASQQEIARMIWRLRHNYEGRLYNQIKSRSYRNDIAKIDDLDWYNTANGILNISPGVVYRWRILLKRLLLKRENLLSNITNDYDLEINSSKARRYRAFINTQFADWLSTIGEQSQYGNDLNKLNALQLRELIRLLQYLVEMQISFTESGDMISLI